MSKIIVIKLTKAGPTSGPFNIYDEYGNLIAENVSKKELIAGKSYSVSDDVDILRVVSVGDCSYEKTEALQEITLDEYYSSEYENVTTGCIWRHLTNTQLYNSFYGVTEPYVIEYPFSYSFQDEILQNVKDYTKAYEYLPTTDGVFSYNTRIETDRKYFNKAILYNGQQCSGVLNLFPKPLHNMKEYMSYPKFNTDSKDILFTKSDNFYQYNTFWSLSVSPYIPFFNTSCESLSVDKVINQANMDYSSRSFRKAPLRAKELKIRHILDDSSSLHLVSQFILAPSQISYK